MRQAVAQTGLLPAGTRLASTRSLANELGIARNTVVYAYEQLLSEGFVSASRQGSVVNDVGLLPKPALGSIKQPSKQVPKTGVD